MYITTNQSWKKNMSTPNKHWDTTFSTKKDSELGWYEKDVLQTLKFLDQIPHNESPKVFLPGAGTSVLVDELLVRGFHLILNDISDEALNKLRKRTGTNKKLRWLHHDISKPLPGDIPQADIWIDRAVLHFLLEEEDIRGYFENVHSMINNQGYVLLAEFSKAAPPKCSGLPLHRYTVTEMTDRMGPEFELLTHENYTYINPFGEPRPYIYALYKKQRH